MAEGMSAKEAARVPMDEVAGALVAIVLVLCAVFLPALILNGLAGAFYRQFAVTIAGATVISLTLSPALAAKLLHPKETHHPLGRSSVRRFLDRASDGFNRGFERMSERY